MFACLEKTAAMLGDVPNYDDTLVNPPDLDWPRLRCFCFFRDNDVTKPDFMRVLGWCLPGLRVWYNLDKEYSRTASQLAIPQLLNEINVLRDPQQAAQRFRSVVAKPGIYMASLLRAADDNDEEPLEQYLERICRIPLPNQNGVSSV